MKQNEQKEARSPNHLHISSGNCKGNILGSVFPELHRCRACTNIPALSKRKWKGLCPYVGIKRFFTH